MHTRQSGARDQITQEGINAAAWELLDWLGDGRSQGDPISTLENVVIKIIEATHLGKDADI